MSDIPSDPVDALEKFFGFRKFLDGQSRVVEALQEGRDALVVMPTGGGKSLCYQLPALMREGITVVVSPLIALMKDQVDALQKKGIAATMINSTLSPNEQQDRIRQIREGAFKLVYVAPERFRSGSFNDALRDAKVGLFAIDEAHCLSQWGHDFRPDYLRIGQALEAIGRPQTAAFTATATPEVRVDILKHLKLENPFTCVTGFERPNLSLNVRHTAKVRLKFERLREIVTAHKTGIVYCATRKRVEEVSEHLHGWGQSVIPYHGGMDDAARERAQNLFVHRERDVAVATNAFGMGIDRSDVRFVVHFEIPGSPEAYYQEAGRAGRDGENAWCELFYNYADTRTQEFFIDGNNPPVKMIQNVFRELKERSNASHEVTVPIAELAEMLGEKNGMAVSSAISSLTRCRAIQRFDVQGSRARGTRILMPGTAPEDLPIDREALEEKERRDRLKINAIVSFSDGRHCRQRWLLEYFGEKDASSCGNCDACRSNRSADYREGTEEEILVVRKALSGIARMSRCSDGKWEGRFGKGRVIQMLTGSRSKDILSAHLDELSTYGLLRSYGTGYLQELFRELQSGGFIYTSTGEYPLISLTERGARAMAGKETCSLNWPDMATGLSAAKAAEVALEEVGFDKDLFEKLRACRSDVAQENGGVPHYVIFNNATLENLTRLRPKSKEAALRIQGIGEVKADKYLAPFLEIISEHSAGEAAAEASAH